MSIFGRAIFGAFTKKCQLNINFHLNFTMTTRSAVPMTFPAADRNKQPLLEALASILPNDGRQCNVLELASGTGQHAQHFVSNLPHVIWQSSDCDSSCLDSIEARVRLTNLPNFLRPLYIDTTEQSEKWAGGVLTQGSYEAVVCTNLIHISPWSATEGLFKGCNHYLKNGGALITYGPYRVHGSLTPESNVLFDQSLRQQNSSWGVRDIDDLKTLAAANNMSLEKIIDMPANNKTLVFRKS